MNAQPEWMPQPITRSQLMARFGIDILSAATTAIVISPIVTIIDSTIMMKAAGKDSFSTCLSRFLRPISSIPYKLFLSKPSRLVFAVYCGTYFTANCFDTLYSTWHEKPAATVTANTGKFATTAVVSTGLTVYKDSKLAQIFGQSGRSVAVPLTSYCLFTLRDAITIFASFNLPTILAPRLSNMIDSETRRLKTAQFLLPAAIQFITTPIHLMGLNFHNHRGAVAFQSRTQVVGRDMSTAIPARIVRILPAFGLGGVVNLSMRAKLMGQIDSSKSR